MKIVLLLLFSFLLGSVPTGLLVARKRGIDIRKIGSGNIGATNILRTTGKLPAIITLAGDFLKGLIAVVIARHFDAGIFLEGISGVFAVLGHNFSIFLKFRGGKGVATSLGVMSIYSPQTALFTSIIWLLTLLITRYSSLGALVSFGILPFSIVFLDTRDKLAVALIITAMMYLRHKDNIIRLMNGTEMKVGKRA